MGRPNLEAEGTRISWAIFREGQTQRDNENKWTVNQMKADVQKHIPQIASKKKKKKVKKSKGYNMLLVSWVIFTLIRLKH